MSAILGYSRHPASAIWPDLDKEEYAVLAQSISEQGQAQPIIATPNKQIVDGWHRLRACAAEGIDPIVQVHELSSEEIAAKIIGAHAGRRHLRKLVIARMVIETKAACGIRFAESGDRGKDDTITRTGIASEANVSQHTAARAITDAKRDRGLLPERQEKDPFAPDPPAEAAGTAETPPEEPAAPTAPAEEERLPAAPEAAQEADEEETAPPAPTDAEIIAALEADLAASKARENTLTRQNEALQEAAADPAAKKVMTKLNNQIALVGTLKARLNEKQAEVTAANRTIRSLRRKLTSAEKALEKEKAKNGKR